MKTINSHSRLRAMMHDQPLGESTGRRIIGRRPRRMLHFALSACAHIALLGGASAAIFEWDTGFSGDWHTPSLWTGGTAPNGAGNSVSINGTGLTVPNSIQYKPLYSDSGQWNPVYGSVFITSPTFPLTVTQQADPWGSDNFGNGSTLLQADTITIAGGVVYDLQGGMITTHGTLAVGGELRLTGNGATVNASGVGTRTLFISGGGLLSQQDGQVSIPDIVVGSGTGTLSTFDIDAGSLAATNLFVGTQDGDGRILQSGGTATVGNRIHLGGFWSLGTTTGEGTYELSGSGALNSNGGLTVGNFDHGSFNQQGGTHTLGGSLVLGANTGVSGTYTLGSGMLSGGQLSIGGSGTGSFQQTGGSAVFSNVGLSNGSLILNGGTFETPGTLHLDLSSTFVSFNVGGGTVTLGADLPITNAVVNLSSGQLNVAGTTTIDSAATAGLGGFRNTGGNHVVTGDIDVVSGSYEISGALADTVSLSSIIVGGDATVPIFHQQGGNVSAASQIFVGTTLGESGTYRFSGGALGTPQLRVGGGTFGTLLLDGSGTLQVDHTRIGGTGPAGMLVDGAVIDINGDLELASFDHTATAVIQSGGSLEVDSLDIGVGTSSDGTLTQNGGSLTVNGTLRISTTATPLLPKSRSYTLQSGGAATTDSTWLGPDGLITQSGTSHHTTRLLEMEGGTFNLGGGTLETGIGPIAPRGSFIHSGTLSQSGTASHLTGELLVGPDALYQLSGGLLQCASSTVTGAFTHSGGNHSISDELSIGSSTGPAAAYSLDGAASTIGTHDLTIGKLGAGTYSQSDGALSATGITMVGNGGNGSFTLDGGSADLSSLRVGLGNPGSVTQNGGFLTAQDVIIHVFSDFSLTGGNASFTSLEVQSSSSFQQSGGSLVTTGGAIIDQSATAPVGFHGGITNIGGNLDCRGLGNLGGGNTLLLVDGGAQITIAGNFSTGSSAALSQSDASSISVTGTHQLAPDNGDNAFHLLANGCTLSSGTAVVGGAGRGNLQILGQHTVTGLLEIGASAALDSRYSIFSTGSLHAGSVHIASRAGGGGRMDLGGGTNTIDTSLTLADAASASGELRLTAGTLNTGTLTVGGAGTGTVIHSNGNLNATGTLAVRSGSGYQFSAGTISAASLDLDGSFEVTSTASTVRLRSPLDNNGTFTAKHSLTTDVSGLSHSNSGLIDLQSSASWSFSSSNSLTNAPSGRIEGTGTLGGTSFQLLNQGTIQPGGIFGWGALTVRGNLVHSPGSLLDLKIAGTATSARDRLLIASGGSAEFQGKLRVRFGWGFVPSVGQSFQLVSGPNLTGNFSSIEVTGLPASLGYTLVTSSNSYTLDIVTALEGWRFQYFGTTANSGTAANDNDPMGDGIANLVKYALGMNPLTDTHGHPHLPRFVWVDDAGSRYGGLEFGTPDPLPSGVGVSVLTSQTLAGWQATSVHHLTESTPSGNLRHVWRAAVAIPSLDHVFLRLDVTPE